MAKIETNSVYYYHNDHLGTPQKMTDANQTVVWAADYKPFGEATVTVSTITNNLRFPGQYYDAETGTLYNYFRDYNPVIGGYLEADRIGLRGGINLYRYVGNNPVKFTDPYGLLMPGSRPDAGTIDQPNLNFPPHTPDLPDPTGNTVGNSIVYGMLGGAARGAISGATLGAEEGGAPSAAIGAVVGAILGAGGGFITGASKGLITQALVSPKQQGENPSVPIYPIPFSPPEVPYPSHGSNPCS